MDETTLTYAMIVQGLMPLSQMLQKQKVDYDLSLFHSFLLPLSFSLLALLTTAAAAKIY